MVYRSVIISANQRRELKSPGPEIPRSFFGIDYRESFTVLCPGWVMAMIGFLCV